MNGSREMADEGRKFLSIIKSTKSAKKFTPSVLYNITAMALEKFVMATCMYHDSLPENHTLTDLMDAVVKHVPVDESVSKAILQFENVQQLCSLEDYERKEIAPDDLALFIASVISFCTMLDAHCSELFEGPLPASP